MAVSDDFETESNATTDSMLGVDKWERTILKFSVPSVFAGNAEFVNKALVQVKRAKTQTATIKSDKATDVDNHYKLLLSASEIRLCVMVDKPIGEISLHVNLLEDDKTVKQLPKNNFIEWCYRNALECLRGNWD